MNITMHLAVVAAVCLCLAEAGPQVRVARAKQQRPTRGFKNVEMMTARGFGKRDRPTTRAERDVEQQSAEPSQRGTPTFKSPSVGVARDFGKRTIEDNDSTEDEYEVPARKIFNPKSSLLVASDFGKRNGNDDSDEDYEIRVIRGFNPGSKVLIARGYGKRAGLNEEEEDIKETRGTYRPDPKGLTARDNGKHDETRNRVYGLDNFWEMLEASPERDGQDGNDDKALESIPLDWFVNEMLNNPDFTRSVVRKFVDINQDGQLTTDELLRNVV